MIKTLEVLLKSKFVLNCSLARITSAPEDRRNVSEIYKRMPISKLIKLVPEVDWIKYLCIVMNKTIHKNETIVLFAHTYVLVSLRKTFSEFENT